MNDDTVDGVETCKPSLLDSLLITQFGWFFAAILEIFSEWTFDSKPTQDFPEWMIAAVETAIVIVFIVGPFSWILLRNKKLSVEYHLPRMLFIFGSLVLCVIISGAGNWIADLIFAILYFSSYMFLLWSTRKYPELTNRILYSIILIGSAIGIMIEIVSIFYNGS